MHCCMASFYNWFFRTKNTKIRCLELHHCHTFNIINFEVGFHIPPTLPIAKTLNFVCLSFMRMIKRWQTENFFNGRIYFEILRMMYTTVKFQYETLWNNIKCMNFNIGIKTIYHSNQIRQIQRLTLDRVFL